MPKDTKLYDILNVTPTSTENDIRKVSKLIKIVVFLIKKLMVNIIEGLL